MVTSRVPADRLASALETQIQILRDEQARTAEIDQAIDEAKQLLAHLQKKREESVARQGALVTTIGLYEELADMAKEPLPKSILFIKAPATDQKSAPARIGKQRYRMLHTIRRLGHVRLEELASYSYVEPRKAKFALSEDEARGFVILDDHGYCLTSSGKDLLKRFENYRMANGLELPPLAPLVGDDDADDKENEVPLESPKTIKALRSSGVDAEPSNHSGEAHSDEE